jgi:hypothetical protein
MTDAVSVASVVAGIHHFPAQGQKLNAKLPCVSCRNGPRRMLARIRIPVCARGIYDLVTG